MDEERRIRPKKGNATMEVTSRTTHLVMPDKYTKEELVTHFKTQGYLLPMEVSNKTLYTAALAKKNQIQIYIPLTKDVVAHDYIIKGHSYELKPEVRKVMEYSNLPIQAVMAITEEVVYNQKGMPLWCEGSRVDGHYYLLLLQYLDPKTYASIKSSTEVTQHVLLLDQEAADYYKVQKKIGKQLEHLRSHAVKLRSIKNDASSNMAELVQTGAFCKTQLVNHVELSGGLDKINEKSMQALKRIAELIMSSASKDQLKTARDYYKEYARVNQVSLDQVGLKIDISIECPPPLQETELSLESFEEIADKLLGFLGQNQLHPHSRDEINAGMPSFGLLVYPKFKYDQKIVTEADRLIDNAMDCIRHKTQIPLHVLQKMLNAGIWRFDPITRVFAPREGWEYAPTIPPAICFKYATSDEGAKIIKRSLDEGKIHVLNPAEYFGKKFVVDQSFMQSYDEDEMLQSLAIPLVQSASLDLEKAKILKFADRIIDAAISNSITDLTTDMHKIQAIVSERRKALQLAFPPLNKIQTEISRTLCTMVWDRLNQDKTVADKISRLDPDKSMKVKIVDSVQPKVNPLSTSEEFAKELWRITKNSLATLKAKHLSTSGEVKLLYEKAVKFAENVVSSFDDKKYSDAFSKYDTLANLGLNDHYGPPQQVASSAQTAGAQTAGFSAVVKGLETVLSEEKHLEDISAAITQKNIRKLYSLTESLDPEKLVAALYSMRGNLIECFEHSHDKVGEALQPLSLAIVLLSQYLLDVFFDAATYLMENKGNMNSRQRSYSEGIENSVYLFRFALALKFRETTTGVLNMDPSIMQTCFENLSKNGVITLNSTKADSLEIKFRRKIPRKNYYYATCTLVWLSLRHSLLHNIPSFTETITKGLLAKHIDPPPEFLVTLPKGNDVQQFIAYMLEGYCGLPHFSEIVRSFDTTAYFRSAEVTIRDTTIKDIPVSVVPQYDLNGNTNGNKTLQSIFLDTREAIAITGTLYNMLTSGSFAGYASSVWKLMMTRASK